MKLFRLTGNTPEIDNAIREAFQKRNITGFIKEVSEGLVFEDSAQLHPFATEDYKEAL